MNTSATINDTDQLVMRLERNHRCVLRMVRKLNSYQFEPKNYDGFVKLQDIKSGFENLAKEQMLLFNELQNQNLHFYPALDKVKASLKKFNVLEQKVAAYILDSHH
ncbi:hypothetical protein [Flavobacterium sp. ASW18X]|uniref:hypothetical protein n=1 Tax=Flavobacterium sp. ASW18X TaxID=2572595 RepID=UPI0010AE01B3|nr:hypothetical protein [Flavobacterium sp. ASW18X]TKD66005.1 hypothetical protein FBT53_03820 [Flavobacterium sp. ASW18X]